MLIEFFPLLSEVSHKLIALENYFVDNLNANFNDMNTGSGPENEASLDPLSTKKKNQEFENHADLPGILVSCRIEICKILILIHVQLSDNALVDRIVRTSNFERKKMEEELAMNTKKPEDDKKKKDDDEPEGSPRGDKKKKDKKKELEKDEDEEEQRELAKKAAAKKEVPPDKQLDWSQFTLPTNTSMRLGV
jgi:hypothetical protein